MVDVDAMAEQQLIAELEDLLERGTTAMAADVRHEPAASYTDPARYAAERALFFRDYPLAVAASAELPAPGDFTTSQIADLPVLTVRGDDGVVRCLVNVCRHRGNRVCDVPSGNRRTFTCEYHAWSYDRAGRLRSTVDREGFAGVDIDGHGLVALPAEERHGIVWALPRPGGTLDLSAYLGEPFEREIADLDVGSFTLWNRTVMTQPFDWKCGVDTFLEVFHLAFLHKKTIGGFFVGNLGAYTGYGLHHRYSAVRTSFVEMAAGPAQGRTIYPHSSLVHLAFPNTILTWQMDHVEMWRFYPGATPGTCTVEGVMLIPGPAETDSARRHWDNNWRILLETVLAEDFATMERVQRNLSTGAVPEVAFGRNEIALQHFHEGLHAELDRHRLAADDA